MRRYTLGIGLGGLLATGLVTAAFAATPSNHHYTGSGGDYWNQGSSWVRHGSGAFSFRTSSAGGYDYIENFRGTYTSACNAGTLHFTATNVLIHKNGKFSFKFHKRYPGSTAYGKIWGAFLGAGNHAQVNYMTDFVSNGRHVRHPYDTSHPRRLGCASWVRGKASRG
jgi:hypothetical protein